MSDGSKNLEELAGLFQGAASVLAVKLPFRNPGALSPDQAGLTKLAVEQAAARHLHEACIVVPGSDGYLLVSDSIDETRLERTMGRLQHGLKEGLMRIGMADALVYENIRIQRLASQFKTSKSGILDHQGYISLERNDRVAHVNGLISTASPQDMSLVPLIHSVKGTESARLLCYKMIPKPETIAASHRDAYYEPNPSCAVVDLALIREATDRKIRQLEAGDLAPLIVPLNTANILDKRYFSVYEIEMRNIPDFVRRLLTFELVRIPQGMPVGRIGDAVNLVRNRVENVYACVAPDWSPIDDTLLMGLDMIGTVLPPSNDASARPQATMQHVARLIRQFQAIRLPTFIHNVPETEARDIVAFCKPDFILPDAPWAARLVETADDQVVVA